MKRNLSILFILLAVVFGYGCEEQQDEQVNTAATIEETGTQTASVGVTASFDSGASGRMLNALGTADEIVSISVSAKKASDDTELAVTDLESIDGNWQGTLIELPYDVSIVFTAQALNENDVAIFSGSLTKTLAQSQDNDIVISLESIDDGVEPVNPVIASISMPEQILIDSDPQAITLEFNYSATFNYTIEVTSGGVAATFGGTPSASITGVHDPSGSLQFYYQAPSSAGVAQLTVTIRDLDSSDEIGASYFLNIVSYDPDTWTDSDVTVQVGPAITDMAFLRSATTLKATATTDPESGLTYEWTGTGDFADLSKTGNPVFITDFDDSKSGTIKVTVTDANNLQAFVTRTIQAGDFPYTVNEYIADMPGLYIWDETTDLMWQDNTNKISRRWADADNYCTGLNLAGYAVWRLPTKNELVNMFARKGDFSNYYASEYWSADEDLTDTSKAMVVSYSDASVSSQRKTRKYLVRCVKD